MFISPDTVVPDPTQLIDYNRYLYARGNPLKYNDPSGHCIWDGCIVEAVVAAVFIGAVANAGGNYIGQAIGNYQQGASLQDSINPDNINKQELVIAGGWGAFGAAAGPVTGPAGFVVANAVAGAGQKVTTDVVVDGKSLEEAVFDPSTVVAAGLTALGAKFGGQVPKAATYSATNGEIITIATGAEAAAYGGRQYASNTADILLSQQVAAMASSRTIGGAIIANLPSPSLQGCNGSFDCAIQFIYANNPAGMPPCTADPND